MSVAKPFFGPQPMDEYLAVEAMSSGKLRRIGKSPRHARAYDGQSNEETALMRFGSVAHCAILEPHKFKRRYAVCPHRRDKTSTKYRLWLKDHPGVEALTQREHDEALELAEGIYENPIVAALLEDGRPEHSAIAEVDGILSKARPDFLSESSGSLVCVSLKSTDSADPFLWGYKAARARQHVADAFYEQVLAAAGHPVAGSVTIVVEREPPYWAECYELEEPQRELGLLLMRRYLAKWRECQASGKWPGYTETGISGLWLPESAYAEAGDTR